MEPADDMEEYRGYEDHAVDPVENAAMALDNGAHVLDADVALDVADDKVAELAAEYRRSTEERHGTRS